MIRCIQNNPDSVSNGMIQNSECPLRLVMAHHSMIMANMVSTFPSSVSFFIINHPYLYIITVITSLAAASGLSPVMPISYT